jgi:glycosyltransferase involved in cell wall biosynthesis
LSNVQVIELNRNYGQATALDAGFKAALGEIVISLDGDGQNDPADIPLLLEKLEREDLDVVAGWRKKRMDKRSISILTVIGRFIRRRLIKDVVHDTGCTLRVYRREAAKSLDIGGEMHRYILGILRWKGFRIGEAVVNHRARVHGVSKYTYSKAIRGFIDLVGIWFIDKYSQRPLHFFGYLSLAAFFVGALAGAWTVYGKLFYDLSINRNGWTFVTMFSLLAGIMLFSFGIIIDLLIRTHLSTSPVEHRYYIRKVVKKQA